ncbi:transcription repressor OFP6 [Cornus florida]|uniref:transcription repressor OFP6 n=1 Tax=Cornus florida TaxID=4283 RepID=UPI002899EEFA|nr:transcription repressor OFP6 [Cornus florida]
MSTNKIKRKLLLNRVNVSLGCSSCTRPRLSNIFHPKPKTSQKSKTPTNYYPKHTHYHTPSSSWDKDTTTTFSPTIDTPYSCNSDTTETTDIRSMRALQGFGRIGGESVAVEKDSDDPYLDFRRSMLQMIMEKEIYSKTDLRELLNCFLQLNSPQHYGTIVRAFTEIWNGVLLSS